MKKLIHKKYREMEIIEEVKRYSELEKKEYSYVIARDSEGRKRKFRMDYLEKSFTIKEN